MVIFIVLSGKLQIVFLSCPTCIGRGILGLRGKWKICLRSPILRLNDGGASQTNTMFSGVELVDRLQKGRSFCFFHGSKVELTLVFLVVGSKSVVLCSVCHCLGGILRQLRIRCWPGLMKRVNSLNGCPQWWEVFAKWSQCMALFRLLEQECLQVVNDRCVQRPIKFGQKGL